MKVAKYRIVQYVDDGVYRYQCLSCKEMFDIRSGPQNYCMNCGIKYEGKLTTRSAEIPRWVYDRYGNDYPFDMVIYPATKPIFPTWTIEERTRWVDTFPFTNDKWSDWRRVTTWRNYSAHDIFDCLLRQRRYEEINDDECIIREFRAVIVKENHV